MSIRLPSGRELVLPTDKRAAAKYLADLFANSGRMPDSEDQVDWSDFVEVLSRKSSKDLTTTSEIQALLETAVQILIRDPVEVPPVITSLFTRIQSKGMSTQTIAGATGAVYAQDVQEHGSYPEVSFQVGGAVSTAWIGKSGIQASFTDEALRYSTWDLMAYNLRNMKNALIRHKEQKASLFLSSMGTQMFNNETPSESLYGVCTGRGIDMAANGTMTMDDLLQGYAHMAQEGFEASVLLCHPAAYFMWLRDPVFRLMLLNFGGGRYYNMWNGNPGGLMPWSNGTMGAMGPTAGTKIVPGGTPSGDTPTVVEALSNLANSAPNIPAYLPLNLSVATSILIPFDPENKLTDVYLLSAGNVGFHLVDQDVTQVNWRDEATETAKVRLLERYGFAVANEGQGIGVYKNVKVAQNYFDGSVRAVDTSGLSEIPAGTPVV